MTVDPSAPVGGRLSAAELLVGVTGLALGVWAIGSISLGAPGVLWRFAVSPEEPAWFRAASLAGEVVALLQAALAILLVFSSAALLKRYRWAMRALVVYAVMGLAVTLLNIGDVFTLRAMGVGLRDTLSGAAGSFWSGGVVAYSVFQLALLCVARHVSNRRTTMR